MPIVARLRGNFPVAVEGVSPITVTRVNGKDRIGLTTSAIDVTQLSSPALLSLRRKELSHYGTLGTSDDGPVLQAAIDANESPVVHLGDSALLNINSPVIVSRSMTIVGGGVDATVGRMAASQRARIASNTGLTHPLFNVRAHNVRLHQITAHGVGSYYVNGGRPFCTVGDDAKAITVGYDHTTGQCYAQAYTHGFVAADVGKYISIPGAGPAGATLHGYVSSIPSGQTPNVLGQITNAVVATAGYGTSVSNQSGKLGEVYTGFHADGISAVSFGRGIRLINAAEWYIGGGSFIDSYQGIYQDCELAPDKGDNLLDHATIRGGGTGTVAAIETLSGGGFRFGALVKVLNAKNAIKVNWTRALSGGFTIGGGASFENIGEEIIVIDGTAGVEYQRVIIDNVFATGGSGFLKVTDTAYVRNLEIGGIAYEAMAANGKAIYLGALVDGCNISSGTIDGKGASNTTGVEIASGALNVQISAGLRIKGVTTRVNNLSSSTTHAIRHGHPMGVDVRQTAAQSIPNTTYTTITLDSSVFDPDGELTPTANSITIKSGGERRRFFGAVTVTMGASGNTIQVRIRRTRSGVTTTLRTFYGTVGAGAQHTCMVDAHDVVKKDDVYFLQVYQSSGGSRDTVANDTWFASEQA